MRERQVLSEIFPAHNDLLPILKRIRKKYGLPDLGSFDKNLTNLLLIKEDIPWDNIKSDIRAKLENNSEFFPEQFKQVYPLLFLSSRQ